jgi:8-oxo-dGTP pyrophosphatase MutT (NUDIX family)
MTTGFPQEQGDELTDIVDERDVVIGRATRREVRARKLLHRGVGILCRNSAGAIYVHRRTDIKDVFPGRYDMFVGGMVGAGETYLDAALRELAEELGVVVAELSHVGRFLYAERDNPCWNQLFEVTWDGRVRPQPEEIAWGAFLSREELDGRLAEWPFSPDALAAYKIWQAWDARRQRDLPP